jgi:CubicO group peptidase (beta-lactamase class C family)
MGFGGWKSWAVSALVGLSALVAPAAAQTDDPLLAQRLAWLAGGGDGVLDVDALTPQETVRGGRVRPLATLEPGERRLSAQAAGEAIALVEPLTTQALLIWRGGGLELEWYGKGYGPESRSAPASMMKPVVALAVGAAIARGKIKSVEDPVGRYVPELAQDPRGAVTLRQLLEMSSGLAPFPPDRSPESPATRHFLGSDIRTAALEATLSVPPGSAFQYNNVNTSLLGMAIEGATGERFAAWVSRALWRPMGASDAAVWLDRPGGFARTYCCLIATARDWVRVGLLLKNDGRVGRRQVVPAAWVEAMRAPSLNNPNFGFQLWRGSPYAPQRSYGPAIKLTIPAAAPFLAGDMLYVDGAGGQRIYISKSEDLVIVRVGKQTLDWDDSRLPNLIVADLRRLNAVPAAAQAPSTTPPPP